MSSYEGYRLPFEEALESAGEALTENGYEVQSYAVFMEDAVKSRFSWGFGENPGEAFDEMLKSAQSIDHLKLGLSGNLFSQVMRGESDAFEILYQNIRGDVQLDEPLVDVDNSGGRELAFGTMVHYYPEAVDGGDYFKVETLQTLSPYTEEDAEQRVSDIARVLEENGQDTKIGVIQ